MTDPLRLPTEQMAAYIAGLKPLRPRRRYLMEDWLVRKRLDYRDWRMRRLPKCPYSGLPIHPGGEAGPGSLSCDVCDCFGFPPGKGGR